MAEIRIGSHTIECSNEDKIFFPDAGITKGDVIAYYRDIAGVMLPYLEDRPLSLQRFPDGIVGEGFYQKKAPDFFPEWIERVRVSTEAGTQMQIMCKDAAALVYLADQATITPHIWLSRADDLSHPDRAVFDLDPPDGDFTVVRTAARRFRDFLKELELPSYVMTTGSRGLHVLVPLDRRSAFDDVRSFARAVAEAVAARYPDEYTVEMRKEKREGRLFLDYLRNAYGQTAVCPYALRPRAGAPVATPLDWEELADADIASDRYTIANIKRRLGQREDPWEDMMRHAHAVEPARERLHSLLEGDRNG